MLRQSLDAMARFSPRFRRLMMRSWYEALVVIDRQKQITFMNYGYADPDSSQNPLTFSSKEDVNRYAIQMYHHVASGAELVDKEVVEIGSGRGGGAAYVARTFKPRSMLGIDISKNAVDFCNTFYSYKGLSFRQGDAENLPLTDESVDVVINVESSHCYGSMPRFLSQVHRVLRPNGHFLFADHRDQDKLDLLRQQLHDAGFGITTETDITTNVVAALRLDDDRKRDLIRNSCPRYLQKEAKEFAAMTGTRTFESFASRESLYLCLATQKKPV